MAFDTVIDKAQLEKEMTASANAIRAIKGESALIEWVVDKGFADAIAELELSGGSGGYPIAEQGVF